MTKACDVEGAGDVLKAVAADAHVASVIDRAVGHLRASARAAKHMTPARSVSNMILSAGQRRAIE